MEQGGRSSLIWKEPGSRVLQKVGAVESHNKVKHILINGHSTRTNLTFKAVCRKNIHNDSTATSNDGPTVNSDNNEPPQQKLSEISLHKTV